MPPVAATGDPRVVPASLADPRYDEAIADLENVNSVNGKIRITDTTGDITAEPVNGAITMVGMSRRSKNQIMQSVYRVRLRLARLLVARSLPVASERTRTHEDTG